MAEFFIGEVEELTGIKSHVLRYWEENVPVLNPRKDEYGRRLYNERDLDFIFRLQYLITERKFTVEGAGEQLLKEIQETSTDEMSISVSKMRSELLNIYKIIKGKK